MKFLYSNTHILSLVHIHSYCIWCVSKSVNQKKPQQINNKGIVRLFFLAFISIWYKIIWHWMMIACFFRHQNLFSVVNKFNIKSSNDCRSLMILLEKDLDFILSTFSCIMQVIAHFDLVSGWSFDRYNERKKNTKYRIFIEWNKKIRCIMREILTLCRK